MSCSAHIEAKVIAQTEVTPGYHRLRLRAPSPLSVQPGQFVHVLPRDAASHDPLLRRAFSILTATQNEFEILYRVQGRGTSLMAQWQAGQVVDLLGPLGRGFAPLPEPHWRSILVGGGVGVPPLAMLASVRRGNQEVLALTGARNRDDLLCTADFERHGVKVRVATDDGSAGHHGLITDVLREELQTRPATVYSCGPWPMLRAVAKLCAELGAPCQVSLEEAMPCGIGVCNGCVVAVLDGSGDYGRYRRVCIDGPVMDGSVIDWDGEVE